MPASGRVRISVTRTLRRSCRRRSPASVPLPSTVESRSIPIALRRRTKDRDNREVATSRRLERSGAVRTRLATVMQAVGRALRSARPPMPEGLSDRAEDVLEPSWRLRTVLVRTGLLVRARPPWRSWGPRPDCPETNQNLGLELLVDIQGLFIEHHHPETLTTQTILDGLKALDDRPWATFTQGRQTHHAAQAGADAEGVRRRETTRQREGDKTFRGYRLDAFTDAFSRYLPSKVEQAEQPNETGPEMPKTKAEHDRSVPLSKTAIDPDKHCPVPLVPLSTPDPEAQEGNDDDAVYSGA